MRLFVENPLEVREQMQAEMSMGNNWLVYNTMDALITKKDLHYFPTKSEADQFCRDNISDYDAMNAIPVKSLLNALEQKINNQSNTIPIKQDILNEIRSHLKEQNASFIKNTTMNQKNFEYLKDQLKYTGFGETLANDLKEKMQYTQDDITMVHNTKIGNDECLATLHFNKSEKSDMYFFNKYSLMTNPGHGIEAMEQTFYINNKGNNITLKEEYNLMNGRAVNKDLINKEGQTYNAWVQLDFKQTDKHGNYEQKQYHSNYGYDLEKELAKHPIKELTNDQDKTRLIESLQRGNRQSVTFIRDNKEEKVFIEASPRFKTLNVYDSNMQRVHSQNQKERNTPEQSVKQELKKETQKPTDDEGDGVSELKTRPK